jgi:TolB-like protein
VTLRAGAHLGAFEILAPLGAGGMGEVYRARDPKLGRQVAIKVLPESLANDSEALARFQVEARALAALSHPNILGIHDLGSEDGVSYAVMELLEGETLRDKLKDGAPLPQRKATEYAREIARGLSAAHEKGVVHRDLKPENVFVTKDERVKILDFGLAKRTEAPSSEDETSAPTRSKETVPGTVMGTVGYMAPEQVRGLAVDHRADIFALGAILYELLTGKRAFKGLTASDTMLCVLRDEPAELSQPQAGIPPMLTRILRHCLEKSPEARAQSAHDVAHELETFSSLSGGAGAVSGASAIAAPERRRIAPLAALAAIAVLALIGGAVALWRRPAAAPGAHASGKRVAVLPFENLGSKEDDYFADGITDEVRGKLTKLPGLGVIARTSSNGYRKTTKTPQEIGKELDVDYLLTGTVRFAGDASGRRVQVSPELVAASTAESKWTQPFDATLTDVFRVQGDIATKVAEALNLALSEGSRKSLEQKPTQNLQAYEAYLRGEQISQGGLNLVDPADIRRALVEYEKAVALDPGFVAAWARISYALSHLYVNSTPTPELAARAREAAEKAVSFGPERPEGHASLSFYDSVILLDNTRALAEAERARALAPGDAFSLAALAVAELNLGRWEEAIGYLEEARRLDPRSAATLQRLGFLALSLRRTAHAREVMNEGLSLAPANVPLLHMKAMTYLQEGDLAGAGSILKAAPKEVPPTALVTFFANYFDLVWLLDEGQRRLLLGLSPSAFDGDRTAWAISLTQAYALAHDDANARKYAELSRASLVEQLVAAPGDAQRHTFLGLSLAYLGRKSEAIAEAKKGVELLPISKDASNGPYMLHQLVRVYILTGEQDKAMDALEELLKVPYIVTKGWLKIDPNFDPLRKNPRFVKLVGGA